MEFRQRSLEKECKFNKLKGASAGGYQGKIRTMFEEMDLQWDLDEFDKIFAAA